MGKVDNKGILGGVSCSTGECFNGFEGRKGKRVQEFCYFKVRICQDKDFSAREYS